MLWRKRRRRTPLAGPFAYQVLVGGRVEHALFYDWPPLETSNAPGQADTPDNRAEEQHRSRAGQDAEPVQHVQLLDLKDKIQVRHTEDERLYHGYRPCDHKECRIFPDTAPAADIRSQRAAIDLVPYLEKDVNREEYAHLSNVQRI